ncbi:MAG: hypothetical protein HY286_04825 [Planctomycetes bacterium]|nr:hypothetical protein [Planctomycetota bacterium]
MPDPVAEALSSLQRRDAAAISQFRDAAERALARFPSLAAERETLVNSALERSLAAVAEFNNIESAARRNAAREAIALLSKRIPAAGGETQFESSLYDKILALPPRAREFVILAFVNKGEFTEVIKKMNLTGNALAAEITAIRQIINETVATPPGGDIPAYVRLPFLATGHIAPDEALRVREHLGQSEPCRAAYRDFDILERSIARIGPAAAEGHPDPDELIAMTDGGDLSDVRKDNIAEHLRLCPGCTAAVAELRKSAPRGRAKGLFDAFDAPSSRKRLAAGAIVASFALPLLIYQMMAGGHPTLEFGGGGGMDLGNPLVFEPARKPSAISRNSPTLPVFTIRVPVEENIAFDLTLQGSDGADVFRAGDVPFVVARGESIGNITFTLAGAKLASGNYQLHLFRRIRGAGGIPADWIYPIVVVE